MTPTRAAEAVILAGDILDQHGRLMDLEQGRIDQALIAELPEIARHRLTPEGVADQFRSWLPRAYVGKTLNEDELLALHQSLRSA